MHYEQHQQNQGHLAVAASLTGGNALAAFVSTIRVRITNIKHENHPDIAYAYYLFLKGLVLWARSPCWEGEGVGLSSSKVFLLDTVGTVFFGLQSNARFLDLFYLHGTSSFRSTDPISSLLDIYCVFYCLPRQNTKLSIVSLLECEYGDLLAFVCAYLALLFFLCVC